MQSQVRKTQIEKPYFGLQNDVLFVWTSQCEQGCSCVGKKKARGRHSNQEKKQLTAKAA